MIIKNANVFTLDRFQKKDLFIQEGRICKEPVSSEMITDSVKEEILDAEGLYAIPGLVDVHFHGAVGHDFCDASVESIQAIAEFEASKGVLAICPATMTFTEEILTPVMEAAAAYRSHPSKAGADLVGINMEGPYISPNKVGAQNPKYVMGAKQEMFERLQQKSSNLIKIVDIAPEEAGNLDFIKANSEKVRISLAHTCTDYDTAKLAFESGAKHMTHLFNAMPGINHREPGPIIAALEEKDVTVELIADGIHIHPAVVRFVFQSFGAERVILISDSLESTGLPDGDYMLGGQGITVRGKKAVLTEKPDTIAGSSSTLFDVFRTAVKEMGIPLDQAVRAATYNPAKAIGIDVDYGHLEPGCKANILLLDKDLNLVRIIKN